MCDFVTDKFICFECIGEKFLSKEVEYSGELIQCSYCDVEGIECYSLLKLADRIDLAFEQHYDRMSEEIPDNWSIEQIKEMAGEWEPDGENVIYAIMDAANISEKIARDVQEILEDKHYSRSSAEIGETSDYHKDSFYDIKSPDDAEWQEKWIQFESILKTKNRFFNNEASSLLSSIFDNLDELTTYDEKPVVRVIGPETDISVLYRARVFQSDEKLKLALESPNTELGPPPTKDAKAGRMNANGIPVFYGATSPETALAEIRPPVGSKVAVGEFEVLRDLRILDLKALTSTSVKGSIFDIEYADLLSRTTFLKNLSQRMTRAIMPDDEQFEYLPTQAIADFLGSQLKFDGIIFPSAQSSEGLNIALFNHASRVKEIKHPKDSHIEAHLTTWEDDEQIVSYRVDIEIPKIKASDKEPKNNDWDLFEDDWTTKDANFREVSLAINVHSIEVKHITSVKINSDSFSVNHSEFEIPPFHYNQNKIEDI